MDNIERVKAAKELFKKEFPTTMVGICRNEAGDGYALAARVNEEEEHGIPETFHGVEIHVKTIGTLRKQRHGPGASGHG